MSWLCRFVRFQSTHPARGATEFQPNQAKPFPFQSTHPARGATPNRSSKIQIKFISIHAPREGCDALAAFQHAGGHVISIHAPREGCDEWISVKERLPEEFQSTHPARGATVAPAALHQSHPISIHAPREGCDHFILSTNPVGTEFQSTHPARGATGGQPLVS